MLVVTMTLHTTLDTEITLQTAQLNKTRRLESNPADESQHASSVSTTCTAAVQGTQPSVMAALVFAHPALSICVFAMPA